MVDGLFVDVHTLVGVRHNAEAVNARLRAPFPSHPWVVALAKRTAKARGWCRLSRE